VIALDTNVLVAAHRLDSQFNGVAVAVVAELWSGPAAWAIPWPCLHEFLAIVTNSRIPWEPTPLDRAVEQVDEWLTSPNLVLLAEGPGYFDHFRSVITAAQASGGLVHDARIAALCLYHSVSELWTADRDFSRFPALKTRNPLVRT
jgi:hypothetical protein